MPKTKRGHHFTKASLKPKAGWNNPPMRNPKYKVYQPGPRKKTMNLACPFCGKANITPARRQVSWRHNEGITIRTVQVCGDCGAQGPAFGPMSFTGEKTAAMYWNRRQANDEVIDGGPMTHESPAAQSSRLIEIQTDMVNHPPHYTSHPSGVECIQVTEHYGFCIGSAIKYLWRAGLKGDAVEDLKKAVWYINREISKRETKQQNEDQYDPSNCRADVQSSA